MGLTHDFYLVDNEVGWQNIPMNALSVKISDNFFISFKDYLRWFHSEDDDGEIREGLSYYDTSIIRGTNLEKFLSILDSLILLYSNSTETFYLTGFFMPEEDIYEKNSFQREEVLIQLNSLRDIVNKAITCNKKILHIGI
ncbi:hypothetical protein [Enterococcus sp. DIV0756]|uniref:hypothetical protein n=1 Tax=Enterococcus sp. DIV0756 TaxID=2774636 RepID=UPI003F24DFCA